MNKICTHCGRFPFCKKINSPMGTCEDWTKRERGLKLESKVGEVFNYKKIGE